MSRRPGRKEIGPGSYVIRDELYWAERRRRRARRWLVARSAAVRLPAPVLLTAFTLVLVLYLVPSPLIAAWFAPVMGGFTVVSWLLWAWEVRDLIRKTRDG